VRMLHASCISLACASPPTFEPPPLPPAGHGIGPVILRRGSDTMWPSVQGDMREGGRQPGLDLLRWARFNLSLSITARVQKVSDKQTHAVAAVGMPTGVGEGRLALSLTFSRTACMGVSGHKLPRHHDSCTLPMYHFSQGPLIHAFS